MLSTVPGSIASAAITPAPRALQPSRQVIGLVLGVPSSVCKSRRATRDKNGLTVLLRQQPRRLSKRRYPQKQRHTRARSGDLLRPLKRLRVSPEEFPTTAAARRANPTKNKIPAYTPEPRLVMVTALSPRVPRRPATRTLATGGVSQSPYATSQQPAHLLT